MQLNTQWLNIEKRKLDLAFQRLIFFFDKEEDTYQDVPRLFVMKSNNILVLIPNRAPNAIASAPEAIWTPASNWLTIFTQLENIIQKNKVVKIRFPGIIRSLCQYVLWKWIDTLHLFVFILHMQRCMCVETNIDKFESVSTFQPHRLLW